MKQLETDVLVVGSGIAGLSFALRASRFADVLLLTKKARADTNTNYAQGGIAAVIHPSDSAALHVRDTLLAGAGLCHRRAVETVVREGPERVRELMELGVEFSREDGDLSLAMEGGHSRRRILHSADLTGQEIERSLLAAVSGEGRIRVLDDHFVWSLSTAVDPDTKRGRCDGALALDVEREEWVDVRAGAVMLATGGAGGLYRHTTNPPIATGGGVALAYGIGAAVANLEFVQFHPTALHPAGSPAFLISEAVRGEGAVLRRPDGSRFMESYDPAGSLASRDVVARAIHHELERTGEEHVLLDTSGLDPEEFAERFPTIARRCREEGIDVPREPVPVVPAAHYFCGGVLTDSHGRSSVAGLLAAGEVACTGVHGANRLASNSLLEAVVFAHRAARRLEMDRVDRDRPLSASAEEQERPALTDGTGRPPDEVASRIRDLMWDRVGIVRSDHGLAAAREELRELRGGGLDWDGTAQGALALREVELMGRVAALVIRAAAARPESRGLHFSRSHPHRDSEACLRNTVLVR